MPLFRTVWVMAWVIVVAALLPAGAASARVEVAPFATPAQESLYADLLAELRCLVCANQSLADSNAALAKDLRGKVYQMVSSGRSRGEITDYLVARYGEYVLYRPRLSPATLLLWVGPFLAAVAGLWFIILIAARRIRTQPYSAAALGRAKSLLADGEAGLDKASSPEDGHDR